MSNLPPKLQHSYWWSVPLVPLWVLLWCMLWMTGEVE